MNKATIQAILSEPAVFAVILLNALVLLLLDIWPTAPDEIGTWILWIDYICIAYFAVEVATKIAQVGFKPYWSDNWNKLDLIVVVISLPILLRPAFPELVAPLEGIAMLRLLRFLRLWRLLRYVQTLAVLAPLKWPTYALLAVVMLRIGLDSISVPPGADRLIEMVGPFVEIMAITWLAIGLYDILHTQRLVPMMRARMGAPDESLMNLMATVVRVLIAVFGLSLALEAAGKNPLALVAGLGIGGMAVAFAAQDAVSNIIAGVLILMHRPFKLGEMIRIGDTTGRVTSIGLRATQLVQFNEEVVTIPNRKFIDESVTNVDRRQSYVHEDLVRLHLSTPVDKIDEAIATIQAICDQSPEIRGRCGIVFNGIGDFYHEISYWYRVDPWTKGEPYANGWDKMRKLRSRFSLELLRRLQASRIRLATSTEFSEAPEAEPEPEPQASATPALLPLGGLAHAPA